MKSYILQIDTATPVCSVALSVDQQICAHISLDQENVHASMLTILIEKVVQEARITLQDLSAIAVSMGPGSYTGLRIGVSTAKGLCYGLDIPLIAINTLEAMTSGVLASQANLLPTDILCPMIDARRLEVYTAMYDVAGRLVRPTAAHIIDVDFFEQWIVQGKTICLFGSGADKFEEMFAQQARVRILPHFKNDAIYLQQASTEKFHRQEFEDLAYFEPYYLKDFVVAKPKHKP